MDIATNGMPPVTVTPHMSNGPPEIEPDQRPVADVAKIKSDPTPEIPLPIPSHLSQTGLIGAAALKQVDAAPKLDSYGVSAAERSLKPYGIAMLPEKPDQKPS